MPKPVKFYDIAVDDFREVTQDDVTKFLDVCVESSKFRWALARLLYQALSGKEPTINLFDTDTDTKANVSAAPN